MSGGAPHGASRHGPVNDLVKGPKGGPAPTFIGGVGGLVFRVVFIVVVRWRYSYSSRDTSRLVNLLFGKLNRWIDILL